MKNLSFYLAYLGLYVIITACNGSGSSNSTQNVDDPRFVAKQVNSANTTPQEVEKIKEEIAKRLEEKETPEELNTEETIEAMTLLTIKCASCHGPGSSGVGSIDYITDIEKLIAHGKIMPQQKAEESRVFARIIDGTMPPNKADALSDKEIEFLRDWIENKLAKKSIEPIHEKTPEEVCTEEGNHDYAEQRLWRLTREQIENSLNDVFGLELAIAAEFKPGVTALGFSNNADYNGFDSSFLSSITRVAEQVSEAALKNAASYSLCSPSNINKECVEALINDKGRLLYRRDLTNDDITSLLELYSKVESEVSSAYGFQAVIQSMIMSPNFIYRQEIGEASGNSFQLSDFEIATALAFTLTNSTPSKALLDIASQGLLSTQEQIKSTASTMVMEAASRDGLDMFFSELLEFNNLKNITKNGDYEGVFTEAIKEQLKTETLKFVQNIIIDNQGNMKDLYTANYTFLTDPLAKYYGIDVEGLEQDKFRLVNVVDGSKVGLLSQGSILALHASSDRSNPIKRGKFFREKILCQALPNPPDIEIPELPHPSPDATTREVFTMHMDNDACRGCHRMIDPVGFGFENYDGIGRFRATENGVAIDSSGEVVSGGDIESTFNGLGELAKLVGDSKTAATCMSTNYFTYALGRADQKGDQCSMAKINKTFFDANMTFVDMFQALFSSDVFIYRKAAAED